MSYPHTSLLLHAYAHAYACTTNLATPKLMATVLQQRQDHPLVLLAPVLSPMSCQIIKCTAEIEQALV